MSADTSSPRRIPAPVALLFAANAATQFAIQAWLAYGFADHVWRLANPLPYLAPVALDVFAINLMAAVYSLRHAPLRQRAYMWGWLGVVIAAQVGASEGFADHENWNTWGRIASLFPAVFLAASLHALIMVARKRDVVADGEALPGWLARRRTARGVARAIKAERKAYARAPKQYLPGTPRVIAATAGQPPAPPPPPPPVRPRPQVTRPPLRPALPAPTRAGHGRMEDPRKATLIKRCLEGGEVAKDVAKELGVGVRTAQLWVAAARQAAAESDASGPGERA